MTKLEPTVIDFTAEAEVRSKAEYRRTAEITDLLKTLFSRWTLRRQEGLDQRLELRRRTAFTGIAQQG